MNQGATFCNEIFQLNNYRHSAQTENSRDISSQPYESMNVGGVNPANQKNGVGSKLLQEIIVHAKQQDRPVFLETSTLKNLPWYERFGFKIYDKLELSYTLYFLSNEPA